MSKTIHELLRESDNYHIALKHLRQAIENLVANGEAERGDLEDRIGRSVQYDIMLISDALDGLYGVRK